MKELEIREFVAELTEIAKKYKGAQQLRARISECVNTKFQIMEGHQQRSDEMTFEQWWHANMPELVSGEEADDRAIAHAAWIAAPLFVRPLPPTS